MSKMRHMNKQNIALVFLTCYMISTHIHSDSMKTPTPFLGRKGGGEREGLAGGGGRGGGRASHSASHSWLHPGAIK